MGWVPGAELASTSSTPLESVYNFNMLCLRHMSLLCQNVTALEVHPNPLLMYCLSVPTRPPPHATTSHAINGAGTDTTAKYSSSSIAWFPTMP